MIQVNLCKYLPFPEEDLVLITADSSEPRRQIVEQLCGMDGLCCYGVNWPKNVNICETKKQV